MHNYMTAKHHPSSVVHHHHHTLLLPQMHRDAIPLFSAAKSGHVACFTHPTTLSG
jgi:hypothetical protein